MSLTIPSTPMLCSLALPRGPQTSSPLCGWLLHRRIVAVERSLDAVKAVNKKEGRLAAFCVPPLEVKIGLLSLLLAFAQAKRRCLTRWSC